MLKLSAKDGELFVPPSQSKLHRLSRTIIGLGALGLLLANDHSAPTVAPVNPRQISLKGEVTPVSGLLVNCDSVDYRHSPASSASRSTLPFFVTPQGEELIQSVDALRSVVSRFVDTRATCFDNSVEPLLTSDHLRANTRLPDNARNRHDLTFSFEGFSGQGESQMALGSDINVRRYEEKSSAYKIEGREDLSYYMAGDGHWISHEDAHKQSFSHQQLAVLASKQLLHPPKHWEYDSRGIKAAVSFEDQRWTSKTVNGKKQPEIERREYQALYFVHNDGWVLISSRYYRNSYED